VGGLLFRPNFGDLNAGFLTGHGHVKGQKMWREGFTSLETGVKENPKHYLLVIRILIQSGDGPLLFQPR